MMDSTLSYLLRRAVWIAMATLALWSQAPCAKGVASPTPTPKEQTNGEKNTGQNPPAVLPIAIVESAEQKISSERREAQSANHDARDLEAQIRAADAAEQQIFSSWVAAILSGAGTLLLIWTLLETRRANRIAAREYGKARVEARSAARDAAAALAIAGQNAEAATAAAQSAQGLWHSERAWVLTRGLIGGPLGGNSSYNGGPLINDGRIFSVSWENSGRSPARKVRVWGQGHVVAIDAPVPSFAFEFGNGVPEGVVGHSQTVEADSFVINDDENKQFRLGKVKVLLYSKVDYRDVFSDVPRISEACFEVRHSGGLEEKDGVRSEKLIFLMVGPQNTAT